MRNPAQARKWVVISALLVAGIWGYRRFREGPSSVMQFPEFITAWGAVYFTLAVITEAAPRFAGSFSILIMVADLLENAKPSNKSAGLLADLNSQLTKTATASTTASTPAPASANGPAATALHSSFIHPAATK